MTQELVKFLSKRPRVISEREWDKCSQNKKHCQMALSYVLGQLRSKVHETVSSLDVVSKIESVLTNPIGRNPDLESVKIKPDRWVTRLHDNSLTDSCAKELASALSTNRSLTDLDLSDNKLGDSGVKLLSVAVRSPECKVQKLRLNDNTLTYSCAEYLASVLNTNQSLTDLNLSDNNLGDSGVKLLLYDNTLTDSCVEDLVSVFSTNQSLTDLNLGNNKLGDSGVKLLFTALRNPDCKIQKLKLFNTAFTDSSARDLASALGTNQSLTDLDLGNNKLGDLGVKLLSAAMTSPDCKIQRLSLYNNALTDTCAEDIDYALSTNQSLTDLNLQANAFTDQSVPALRHFIMTCRSLAGIKLEDNQFSSHGKNQLKSLQGSRPGLNALII
ncbi:NACHT, LRR and PYD domains-containing protein 3-like [Scyliorhinus torazame]|uniref:NACHT, LRR and PYD domains-containing protein 3-like n=1 Tax=Scyliorhinus torazame TaxID=75743 RepID=UPI003B5A1875